MHPLRRWRALLTSVLAISLLASPAELFAQSKNDVDEAREQREEALSERAFVGDELEAAVTEYQRLNAELADLTYKVVQLQDRVTTYESEVRGLRNRARDRALQAYMLGGTEGLDAFFVAESFNEVVTSQRVLEQAANRNLGMLERLAATRRQLERLRADLEVDEDTARQLRSDADEIRHQLDALYQRKNEEFAEADDEYRRAVAAWEAEKRRRRLAELARLRGAAAGAPSAATPGFICPVPGGTFINDWGNPRSGGRRHRGTDLFGPRGTPNYAVATGTVRLRDGGLGGRAVWLYADHGSFYYYAHLDSFGPGLSTGDRVSRGDVIGYLGSSGNARGGSPHTHFQIHPGGGVPVNPYPTLVKTC